MIFLTTQRGGEAMSEAPDRDPAGREFGGGQPVGQQTEFGRPRRNNLALWIAGAAVLVAAIVVVVVVSVSGDDDSDPNGPTGVASAVVDALNAQDEAVMRPLMCEPRVPNVLAHMEANSSQVQYQARLEGSATVTGYSATAQVVLNAADEQTSTDLNFKLYLAKRGSGWCADQFYGPDTYTGP
jgi:hypothetical protein